jgi:hypothetical protein
MKTEVSLTEQFWAQHYPGGDITGLGADYPELQAQAHKLVQHIRCKLNETPAGD